VAGPLGGRVGTISAEEEEPDDVLGQGRGEESITSGRGGRTWIPNEEIINRLSPQRRKKEGGGGGNSCTHLTEEERKVVLCFPSKKNERRPDLEKAPTCNSPVRKKKKTNRSFH